MSSATSTISRSAPRPERSTASACSMLFGVGDLGAAVHRDLGRGGELALERADDQKSHGSLLSSVPFRLDDFRHGHAELVLDQHDFAARDQAVVDVDVDRLADLAVELEHGAGPSLSRSPTSMRGAAEHGRDLHRHVEHRLEIGGAAVDVAVGSARDRGRRPAGGMAPSVVEIGQRNFARCHSWLLISPKLGHRGGLPRAAR